MLSLSLRTKRYSVASQKYGSGVGFIAEVNGSIVPCVAVEIQVIFFVLARE